MATLTLTNPLFYKNGISGVSTVVGYEDNANRVCRYQFTAPAEGASSLSFTLGATFSGYGSANEIRFLISENGTGFANAGKDTAHTGTVSFSGGTATGSANFLLLPGKTYYLWFFPGTSGFGWYWWAETATVTTSGGAGLVYYDTGSALVPCIPYYDTGSSWVQLLPYYDTGSAWSLIT